MLQRDRLRKRDLQACDEIPVVLRFCVGDVSGRRNVFIVVVVDLSAMVSTL
jgi:hypothetical protein